MKQLIMYRLAISSFLLIGALSSLKAQGDSLTMIHPIEPDRPDQSETASITPKGYFQMENGFSIEDTDPGFIYTYPSTLWKVGVNENFEVRILTEYINIQHEPNPDNDGLLPIQVGFKAKLLSQHGVVPKAAVLGHLSLPGIASKQFETTYFAPSMRLVFQNDVTKNLSVSYNLGVEWNGEDPRPTFLYTFSPAVSLFHGLSAFLEVYGDVPQQRDEDFKHRLDGGFTYLVSNDVIVDVSGGIGLSDNAPEKFIAVGLSYRFKM